MNCKFCHKQTDNADGICAECRAGQADEPVKSSTRTLNTEATMRAFSEQNPDVALPTPFSAVKLELIFSFIRASLAFILSCNAILALFFSQRISLLLLLLSLPFSVEGIIVGRKLSLLHRDRGDRSALVSRRLLVLLFSMIIASFLCNAVNIVFLFLSF